MRRMYSEQELTKIIKEVSEAYISELIEEGEFDQDIADYVDAYLVEHPVDITALEGKTIAPTNVNATGNITGASIIENMSGYSFAKVITSGITMTYAGCVKNGNKITFAVAFSCNFSEQPSGSIDLGSFTIPTSIYNKLYPFNLSGVDFLDVKKIALVYGGDLSIDVYGRIYKEASNKITFNFIPGTITTGRTYYGRIECTFLLSENLAA